MIRFLGESMWATAGTTGLHAAQPVSLVSSLVLDSTFTGTPFKGPGWMECVSGRELAEVYRVLHPAKLGGIQGPEVLRDVPVSAVTDGTWAGTWKHLEILSLGLKLPKDGLSVRVTCKEKPIPERGS